MTRKAVAWCAMLMVFAATAFVAGPVGAAGDDRKAVADAAAQFYTALNAMFTGDLAPMTEVWSHANDVTYMGPAGDFRVGWGQVLASWKEQAAMKLGGKVEPQRMRITVGRDLAVTHNVEVGENIKDGKPQKVSIRATNIFRKEKGKWKMIGHHTDLLPYLKP
jgi:ketosteroid isomerase-like protein